MIRKPLMSLSTTILVTSPPAHLMPVMIFPMTKSYSHTNDSLGALLTWQSALDQISHMQQWHWDNSMPYQLELTWHALKAFSDTSPVHFIYHYNSLPLHNSRHFLLLPHVVFQTRTGPPTKRTEKVSLVTVFTSLTPWSRGHPENNALSPLRPLNRSTTP